MAVKLAVKILLCYPQNTSNFIMLCRHAILQIPSNNSKSRVLQPSAIEIPLNNISELRQFFERVIPSSHAEHTK